MPEKKKYYAVKNGRQIGIFSSWLECKEQIHSYSGALYKGFATMDEAETYMGFKETLNQPLKLTVDKSEDKHHIYVDGSYRNDRYSWGFAVFFQGKLIHTANGIGTSTSAAKLHNVAGEVEASIQAVLWAEKEKLESIVIYHDYIGISEWAERRWKTNNDVTKQYAAFMADYLGWVTFRKISGHTGVEGNELADKLAKAALEIS
jgi:ribonuclease HI